MGMLFLGLPQAATGKSLMGFSLTQGGMFKNWIMSVGGNNADSPGLLDVNGYPTTDIPSNVGGNIDGIASTLVTTSVTMVLRFEGKGQFQIGCSYTNLTVTKGSSAGSNATNIVLTGTAGARCTFQFTAIPEPLTTFFPGGGSGVFDGTMSGLILCQSQDEAVLIASPTAAQMWDDNYVNAYIALNPNPIRPMGWTGPNSGNVSQSRYIPAWNTSINVSAPRWEPRAWAGSTSGTNTYTCSSQPDATGSYIDGEMIQLKFANAATLAPLTINSGSRGAKPLLYYNDMSALAAAKIGAGTLATLTYDALLDSFIFQATPQTPCIPYELQIAFANRVNANLWLNFPTYFNDASVTAIATLVRTNLNPNLKAYFEYGNEVWNNTFPGTDYAFAKGRAFGFSDSSDASDYGWYGYRVRTIMPLVVAAWSPRARSQLKCVMAIQMSGSQATVPINRLEGAQLAPVGTGAGQGNALWNSYTGSANYSAYPNRPIDVCDVLSYATYYSGNEAVQFDQSYINQFNAGLNINGLTGAADSFAAGGSGIATGLAWLDNDIRAGTQSDGSTQGNTLFALKTSIAGGGNNIYPGWEAIAASYDASGRATPLTIECYEGGESCIAPATSTCTAIGISTTYGGPGGKIDNLIMAYRNSSLFYATVLQQFADFKAAGSHSTVPGWLLLPSDPSAINAWSLTTGDEYAARFQSYYAVKDYNHS